jgi:hypothetical protein
MSKSVFRLAVLSVSTLAAAFGETITFEPQCPSGQQPSGPCSALFSTVGNSQTLMIPTSIGSVTVSGGALFDTITNLPSDETAVYGTAGNSANIGVFPASGFTNPLTLIFPKAITGFSLDVLNGNTMTVDYHLADNAGNSADFQLAPNLSGGQKTIAFAATGTQVTIGAMTGQSTPSGMTWDFLIDNVTFQTTAASTPEPSSFLLIGLGLLGLGLAGRTRRGIFFALPVLLALPCWSDAATLVLADANGDSVTIDSSGMPVCAGYCITSSSSAAPAGNVAWSGTLGVFNVSVAGGQSKPALTPAQIGFELRVSTGAFGAGAGNMTLTAKWSDTGFSATGVSTMTATSSSSGTVSASYAGSIDGMTVGNIGPFTSASTATVLGSGPVNQPFSMAETATVTMGGNSSFTLESLNLAVGSAPLMLGCPSASGQLNVPYLSGPTVRGGRPPYSFYYRGTLPGGLLFNPGSGQVSGTPTIPGTYSFTLGVLDLTQNPVEVDCSIAIAASTSPLSLTCPDSSDEVGVLYSSSFVATGGVPPYVFSIASGAIPAGLTLDPTTGDLVGIDASVTGTFTYIGSVTDSANAANKAAANCMLAAAPPSYTMVAAPNTTPQSVVVNSALVTPLAVIVTDSKTKKPVQGVTVTFTVIISPKTIPSGMFAGGDTNDLGTLNSFDATTDAKGIATASRFTANTVVGAYTVIARATGALKSVTFNITNTAGVPMVIVPVSGSGQTTTVLAPFKNVLVANVTDFWGNPVPNYPVLFSAPPAGSAGATFGAAATPTVTVNTDSKGNATSPVVTANKSIGTYSIQAAVVRLSPVQVLPLPANFPNMKNNIGPPAKIYRVVPAADPMVVNGWYYAVINTAYTPLKVEVDDIADNPIPGLEVKFTSAINPKNPGAPFGAGSILQGYICKINTGANGRVTSCPLTANGVAGTFNITATVTGTNLKLTYFMENMAVGKVPVPDVVGMTQAQATTALTASKLVVGVIAKQASATVPAGSVISQNPARGTVVDANSKVSLTISTGK